MPTVYITVAYNKAVAADWLMSDAEDRRHRFLNEGIESTWYRLELPSLSYLVSLYFQDRVLKDPDLYQAYLFLVSEVGELADSMNQQETGAWVRNNPDDKHTRPEREGGDVLMMLIKTMEKLGHYDPLDEMLSKWREKGFGK